MSSAGIWSQTHSPLSQFKMGCKCNGSFRSTCHIIRSLSSFLFFLLILMSSTQLKFQAEGRPNPKSSTPSFHQVAEEEDEAMAVKVQIGSRPPRCKKRCSTCGHCEAIQVPTNPQLHNGAKTNSSSTISSIAYARRDDDYSSNYKPMSWKCKCGNFIFNP